MVIRIWRRVIDTGKMGGLWLLNATMCSGNCIGSGVGKVTGESRAAMHGASLMPRLMQIIVCWYWHEVWSCSGDNSVVEGLEMCPKLM